MRIHAFYTLLRDVEMSRGVIAYTSIDYFFSFHVISRFKWLKNALQEI